jgi:carboxyl-terminal processing protease
MPVSPSRRLGVVAVALLAAAARPASAQTPTYELVQSFSYLLSQVRLNYVLPVNTEQLVHASIAGMLRSLDPHSRFVPRAENDRWMAWEAGRLAGTGIALEDEDGAATVAAIRAGSPAERAGILPGDRVLALNDTSVSGLTAQALQLRLVGEQGSRVRLLLERGLRVQPETLTVSVRHDLVTPRSVADARSLAPDVAYVRLEGFEANAAPELRQAVERVLTSRRPRALVLDMRGNPGGQMRAAVAVASLFFPKGVVVFRTEGRRQEMDSTFVTTDDGALTDLRLVVLIDAWTASAAEALAGALQDHDRAVILGRRSFGKALVQRLYEVPPNGDAVWLTVGYIHTPSGRLIQRRYAGLTPEQYYTLAGHGGAAEDTAQVFKTDSGRPVRGGGGIEPDSELPAATTPPLWWSAAADSNFEDAIADSVAPTLDPSERGRAAWLDATDNWRQYLLTPFLARVRSRLGVTAAPDSGQQAAIAKLLAARAAEVRWGAEFAREFRLHSDSDVRVALARLVSGRGAAAH